jgi:rhomboid protease GluP
MTLGILILNCSVHLLMFLTSAGLNKFAISPALVLFRGEYYRIVTCAFLHSGILHIAMNMSSHLQLGVELEAQFGSLQFLFMSAWAVLLIGAFYCALEW